jgi:hypothetical protein
MQMNTHLRHEHEAAWLTLECITTENRITTSARRRRGNKISNWCKNVGLWQLAWLEIEGAEEKEDASSEA